jgi:hypothetical protein
MAEELRVFKRLPRRGAWEILAFALGFAGTLLLHAALIFIFSPFLICLWIHSAIDERRTRRRLTAEGRLIGWDQARERVLAGDGILVVELLPPNYRDGHTWWIDARRLAEHPECPLPEYRHPRDELFSPPVNQWCREHLTALMDTASRVDRPRGTKVDDGLPAERVRVIEL